MAVVVGSLACNQLLAILRQSEARIKSKESTKIEKKDREWPISK